SAAYSPRSRPRRLPQPAFCMLGANRGPSRRPGENAAQLSHGVSMDSLHAIGFYASSGVSVIGGLGVALLAGRTLRGASLAISGVGLAGIYLFLGAGFAALVALVCYLGCATLVAGPRYRSIEATMGPIWRQIGAVAAGVLLAILAFSAF